MQANPFASLVSREIRRAIRTKCDLSLALFRIEGGRSDAVPLLDLVTHCVKRNLRATDEYAVLADNLVAVLLLETDGAGASAYAQRLLHEMSTPRVSAQAHSYPSTIFDDFRAGNFGSPGGTPSPLEPNAHAAAAGRQE